MRGAVQENDRRSLDAGRWCVDELKALVVVVERGRNGSAGDRLRVGTREHVGRWLEVTIGRNEGLMGTAGGVVVVLPTPIAPAELKAVGKSGGFVQKRHAL